MSSKFLTTTQRPRDGLDIRVHDLKVDNDADIFGTLDVDALDVNVGGMSVIGNAQFLGTVTISGIPITPSAGWTYNSYTLNIKEGATIIGSTIARVIARTVGSGFFVIMNIDRCVVNTVLPAVSSLDFIYAASAPPALTGTDYTGTIAFVNSENLATAPTPAYVRISATGFNIWFTSPLTTGAHTLSGFTQCYSV